MAEVKTKHISKIRISIGDIQNRVNNELNKHFEHNEIKNTEIPIMSFQEFVNYMRDEKKLEIGEEHIPSNYKIIDFSKIPKNIKIHLINPKRIGPVTTTQILGSILDAWMSLMPNRPIKCIIKSEHWEKIGRKVKKEREKVL